MLCSSVRRFRDATVKPDCKADYPHALQASGFGKALDRAEIRFNIENFYLKIHHLVDDKFVR
jgi:hypothetical protein